ncbi:YGGT family protein [Novosphingobium pentaromativorans US6-1]|uniref:YGGT family protein n=1 Tax=Novosphingobium pentaromativorans US6-1 TaxID=1088721 RepID=G6E9W4_9SPHN|nr:YGGT family protein [Novosphingobium pentaromativorans US6-1]
MHRGFRRSRSWVRSRKEQPCPNNAGDGPSQSGTQTKNPAAPDRVRSGSLPDQRKSSITGGAEGDRTPDLVIANDALSQLSYGPVPAIAHSGLPPRERLP